MPRVWGSIARVFAVLVGLCGLAGVYFTIQPLPQGEDRTAVFALVALAALGIALVCEIIFLYYLLRKEAESRGASKYRFVSGVGLLEQELYKGEGSVVASAEQVLVVTGSRSRDEGYLKAIEERISNSALCYVRILVGPPQHQSLQDHIDRLRAAAAAVPGWPKNKVLIVETPLGGEWPERFLCASENKMVVISQSPNSPLAFDSALVVEDPRVAAGVVGQLRAYAESLSRKQASSG